VKLVIITVLVCGSWLSTASAEATKRSCFVQTSGARFVVNCASTYFDQRNHMIVAQGAEVRQVFDGGQISAPAIAVGSFEVVPVSDNGTVAMMIVASGGKSALVGGSFNNPAVGNSVPALNNPGSYNYPSANLPGLNIPSSANIPGAYNSPP
jgi:hypothetical protein